MFNEFKEFIARGNVMDLAVGIIIGGAFGLIVTSVVEDIIMPLVGLMLGGGVDFSNYFLPLAGDVTANSLAEAREQGAVLAYGNFITVAVNFLILAFIIFLIIKGVNRLRRRQDDPGKDVAPPPDILLLTEIRDLLKK